MAEPLLFISHKHSDRGIAEVLANFVEVRSNARVKVHLSSSPDFQGPKLGRGLNAQLRAALWKTEVLLLVYTSPDQDWSYCMWECGVAALPDSPDTQIIVFQCGAEAPAPFADEVRVDARSADAIRRFADQFLRDPTFFPSLGGAVAPGLKDVHIESAAKELHQDLGKVLPSLELGLVEQWPAWPYLQIEMPRAEVDRLQQAPESERATLSHKIVREHGLVVESDPRAAQLFGQAGFPQRMKLEVLLTLWQGKYPGAEAAWFDSCCEQIMIGAGRGFPVIRWTPIREVGGDGEFTPVVSRITQVPFSRTVHFDLYLYNLSDPRAIPVASRMILAADCFHKKLGEIDPPSLKLKALVEELEGRNLNRVPIFHGDGHAMYIIHRSMVDKFIVTQVLSGVGGGSAADLTLADLLADPEMSRLFEETFVVVKRQATLAEAKSAMLARPGCSDVFVTAEGGQKEPVQGWLTNVDIARNA